MCQGAGLVHCGYNDRYRDGSKGSEQLGSRRKYRNTRSDHKYIKIGIEESKEENSLYREKIFLKWHVKNIEKDWYITSVICDKWLKERQIEEFVEKGEIEKAEKILKRIITDACNNSMKKENGGNEMKRKVYWWCKEIADVRGRCKMWRWKLIRAKRQDRDLETQLAGKLKNSRKALRKAIGNAKKTT